MSEHTHNARSQSGEQPLPLFPTEPSPTGAEPASALARRPPRGVIAAVGIGLLALLVGLAVWLTRDGEARAPDAKPTVPFEDGGDIVVPAAFAKVIDFASENVTQQTLTAAVRAVGTAIFDPHYEQVVGTRVAGIVTKLLRFEGEAVRKGDVLAEVTSAELADAQATVIVARAALKAAERNRLREGNLAKDQLTTAREVEEAERELQEQRARLEAGEQRVRALGATTPGTKGTYPLVAGIAGTVVERHINLGQAVDANLEAFHIANLDHLWVEMRVPESSLENIRSGDTVQITGIDGDGPVIEGRVAHIGNLIDPETRTADIRVEVDNQSVPAADAPPEVSTSGDSSASAPAKRPAKKAASKQTPTELKHLLRAGQAVKAEIQATGVSAEVVTVPEGAVVDVDGEKCVFLHIGSEEGGAQRVRRVPVELGTSDGTFREVRAGLSQGQRVVTTGVFALKSELYR